MKRDPDLMRDILINLEDSTDFTFYKSIKLPGKTPEEISYHIKLLFEAGMVDAQDKSQRGTPYALWKARSMTPMGHDFLDSVRAPAMWEKAKGIMGRSLESVSIGTLTALMSGRALKWLGGDAS